MSQECNNNFSSKGNVEKTEGTKQMDGKRERREEKQAQYLVRKQTWKSNELKPHDKRRREHV